MEYRYMIYNNMRKCFQFPSICELSYKYAERKLFNTIGKDAFKWRFEIRKVDLISAYKIRVSLNKKNRGKALYFKF